MVDMFYEEATVSSLADVMKEAWKSHAKLSERYTKVLQVSSNKYTRLTKSSSSNSKVIQKLSKHINCINTVYIPCIIPRNQMHLIRKHQMSFRVWISQHSQVAICIYIYIYICIKFFMRNPNLKSKNAKIESQEGKI